MSWGLHLVNLAAETFNKLLLWSPTSLDAHRSQDEESIRFTKRNKGNKGCECRLHCCMGEKGAETTQPWSVDVTLIAKQKH
jgi:hypothetical protein